MRGLKIHIIIIAFVTTVAVAVGGNFFSYQYRVVKPLMTSITAIPGVTDASVQNGTARHRDIVVSLQPKVNRAVSAYLMAEQLARQNLGTAFGEIKVNDNRDGSLEAVFYKMHFHLQQAIATGMFTQMEESINAIARQEALQDHQVIVEQERVIICLSKGERMLFTVMPRFSTNIGQQTVERRAVSLW